MFALIKAGADINAQTKSGNTPLHSAALTGQTETAFALVNEGINLFIRNNKDKTAYAGINLFIRNNKDKTALQVATKKYGKESAIALFLRGAMKKQVNKNQQEAKGFLDKTEHYYRSLPQKLRQEEEESLPYGVIYVAANWLTRKKYVGQTTMGLAHRRFRHYKNMKRKINSSPAFYKALREYPTKYWTWAHICWCDNQEELDAAEQFYIAQLQTQIPNGYNIHKGSNYDESPDDN